MTTQTIAVFIDDRWLDANTIRRWTMQHAAGSVIVLFTDDLTDGNQTLARQLRCQKLVSLCCRRPFIPASAAEAELCRRQRDEAMVQLAESVVQFTDEKLPEDGPVYARTKLFTIRSAT